MADALVSGSSEAIHVGSSPVVRTKQEQLGFVSGCSCFFKAGLEGETVQSGLPVDVRDRGRPSAQFARESSPVVCTNKTSIDLAVVLVWLIKYIYQVLSYNRDF